MAINFIFLDCSVELEELGSGRIVGNGKVKIGCVYSDRHFAAAITLLDQIIEVGSEDAFPVIKWKIEQPAGWLQILKFFS
jgi:hypothetical protein